MKTGQINSCATSVERVTIIGTGLIGGSLALALKQAGFCREVVGSGRNEAALQKAVELKVIDRYNLDIAKAAAGAEIIVVCVPIGAMQTIFKQLEPALKAGAIITDVGSVKNSVIIAANEAWGELPERFIPGHPIAGTEKSGVEAAFATLYQSRRVILTPHAQVEQTAVDIIKAMWKAAGSTVHIMDPLRHDDVLAGTSHLPHMLAFGLVNTLADLDETREIFAYAAGGFRDFTRIASSDPVMWRDICVANRDAINRMMSHYVEDMLELAEVIRAADGEKLLQIFTHAKQTRDRFTHFFADKNDL